jgi:hypothetical protein
MFGKESLTLTNDPLTFGGHPFILAHERLTLGNHWPISRTLCVIGERVGSILTLTGGRSFTASYPLSVVG